MLRLPVYERLCPKTCKPLTYMQALIKKALLDLVAGSAYREHDHRIQSFLASRGRLDSLEIDEPTLHIRAGQSHAEPVANLEAFEALD